MKRYLCLMVLFILALVSCRMSKESDSNNQAIHSNQKQTEVVNEEFEDTSNTGDIYLYGEIHGQEKILQKELELWKLYYHEEGMRHLFLEAPYSKAQLLNIWMTEDNDDILLDHIGSNYDLEAVLNFYKAIKNECPETIFHGIDVNGYKSFYPGIEYRNYLEENDLVDSEMYLLNELSIEQVKHYANTGDETYREKMLVENFIREFDTLEAENIMGIFGAAHIVKDEYTKESDTVYSMAYELGKIYGKRVSRIDLTDELLKGLLEDPLYIEDIEVLEKSYKAEYYGINEHTGSEMIVSFEYWKLIGAYEDLKNSDETGQIIPAHNYPMKLDENSIYLIIATLKDHTTMIYYTLSDGSKTEGHLITKQIIIE